jgi:uncharacterized GH25 family protein
MGPKNRFEQVLSCFHYDLRGKTYLYAGKPSEMSLKNVGDPLEIIALERPFNLKRGSEFPVQIVFQWRPPLRTPEVQATYAGFSNRAQHLRRHGQDRP